MGAAPGQRLGLATIGVGPRISVGAGAARNSRAFSLRGGLGSPCSAMGRGAVFHSLGPGQTHSRGRIPEVFLWIYNVSLSMEEAESSSVIIALRLNREALPQEHGGHCRFIAGAKECNFSVKWVDLIGFPATPAKDPGMNLATRMPNSPGYQSTQRFQS